MLKFTDINFSTNEIVERELTTTELDFLENKKIETATRQAEAEAKAAQRQAILDRLGLTSEEANLLLS